MSEQKRNYQKELDALINGLDGTPSLLLHSCCAPCSSYVMEYLSRYFAITVLYYNPNIYPPEEFDHRADEERRLIDEYNKNENIINKISLIVSDYDPREFYDIAKGYEDEPETGKRCLRCYRLRLEKTAALAKDRGFDYFTTTLTISPLKNADALNSIGEALADEYGVKYLTSDFKKKNGYKRSLELSREYDLYRQNYCGCEYSMK